MQDDDLTGSYGDQELPNLRARLQSLASDFSARVVLLLGDLSYQPDADLRLLSVLLSFNEFYPVVHKRRIRERVGGAEMVASTRRGTPRTVVAAKSREKSKAKPDSDAQSAQSARSAQSQSQPQSATAG